MYKSISCTEKNFKNISDYSFQFCNSYYLDCYKRIKEIGEKLKLKF